ncbi:hypothetical protein [Chitinophaga barathri]|nr:hypothetical protein [Chitinophaga barathri]
MMKKSLPGVLIIILNVGFTYLMLFACVLADFFWYGEGAMSVKNMHVMPRVFAVIQILVLSLLFWRKKLIHDFTTWLICILTLLVLFKIHT